MSSVPSENVATIASCASVIEGVSRSRNALLNGDTRNYDWDSGYTCHQLGSGAIVIQLAQPYSISSLRYIWTHHLLWEQETGLWNIEMSTSGEVIVWSVLMIQTIICPSLSWYSAVSQLKRTMGTFFHLLYFICIFSNQVNTEFYLELFLDCRPGPRHL